MITRTLPLLTALTAACSSGATWSQAFDAEPLGSLSGVWGSGSDDVVVVGGTRFSEGLVRRFDGRGWADEPLPEGTPLLVWVHGFGPDEAYAVGVDGAMVRWDGTAWSTVTTGTTTDLWGIFGFTPDALWIVGGDVADPTGEPLLLRYDGSDFQTFPLDDTQNPFGANALFKVWGIGERLFAVGARGTILSWEDGDWVFADAGAEADDDFVSLSGTSPDDIVAVGGRASAQIATFDGTAWTTVAPAALPGMNAVFMTDPDTAVIGGVRGWVGTYAPAAAQPVEEGVLSNVDIHAAWGDGQGRVYAVGGTFLASNHSGVALVRE